MSNHYNVVKHKSNHKKKQAVELVFNSIKNCKHQLNHKTVNNDIVYCAFCKLINLQTRSFFKQELLKRKEDHENSNNNRAIMRTNLLIDWSKCQSSLYCDYYPTKSVDVFLSVTMANLIISLTDKEREFIDFQDIVKLLIRKNRLIEVGYFAAIYLQSRIRSFLAKLRVKKMMLFRFEYVSATKRKGEYFVDTQKQHKWERYPHITGDEAPASPRTITRRLAAVDRRRDARLEKYKYFVKSHHINEFNLFEQEDNYIARLRQFVIFRDIVSEAMNTYRIASTDDYKPVWVTISAPGLPARELGLALAISHYPAPEGENLNKRLHSVEELTLQSLVCDSPDQVLSLCLIACGRKGANLSDVVQSVVNISQDDRHIWSPIVDLTDVDNDIKTDHSTEEIKTKDVDNHLNNNKEINNNQNNHLVPELLPLYFQIHPHDNTKTSNGLFRLFFYEQELLGITQYSPWVYYPEISKNKDNILYSINTYVNLPTTKTFIRNYYNVANDLENRKIESISKNKQSKQNNEDNNNNNNNLYKSFFIPPDNSIFDISKEDLVRKPLDNKTINDEKALELNNKYSFIKKLSLLTQRIKRGQNNYAKNLKKGINTNKSHEVESMDTSESHSHDFVGTELYKLSKTPAIKKNPNHGAAIPKLDISKYSRRLLKYGKETVNTDMSPRIIIPPGNEVKEYKLLVMDIYVHLPRPNMKSRGGASDKHNSSTHSVSMSTLTLGETVNLSSSHNLYNVDSHHIIGIFPCDQERPPPNVDMGLLQWSIFHQMHKDILLDKETLSSPKPTTQDRSSTTGKNKTAPKTPKTVTNSTSKPGTSNTDSKPTTSSSSLATDIKDKSWSFPDSRTGLSTYNSRTNSGRNLQFSIIGNIPSEEYLLEELPQGLQKWLKRDIM